MEHFDSDLAHRVWQRVQASPESVVSLAILDLSLREEAEQLRLYRQLLSSIGTQQVKTLREIVTITIQCITILKGIRYLFTDTQSTEFPSPQPKEHPTSVLRRCYGSTLQRMSRYRQLSADAQYAPGFSALADLSQTRCQLLLQLLG